MNILITGASSGIGKSLAFYLVKSGHKVWGLARRGELLAKLKDELNSENFFYSVCDVSVHDNVLKIAEEMKEKKFTLDVIILNAAIFPNDISPQYNHQLFEKTFAINFHGAMAFVGVFLGAFFRRGCGHFIAICSTTAFRPSDRGVGYPASKTALAMTFRGMNLAYHDKNVIFSTVYLGPVSTAMWEGKNSFLVSSADKVAAFIAKVMRTRKPTYYFPFFSTSLFRLSLFLPDRLYLKMTKTLLK